MFLSEPEDFKTLAVDPGEDTGWCIGLGPTLLAAGTTKLWPFADDVWSALTSQSGPLGSYSSESHPYIINENDQRLMNVPIGRIICEDFRIYPNKAKDLSWNPVRTARLIGALTFMAREKGIEFHLQPAAIKKRAEDGGAAEFFFRPLDENRHQNDAIRHWWYFVQLGPEGDARVANRVTEAEQSARR